MSAQSEKPCLLPARTRIVPLDRYLADPHAVLLHAVAGVPTMVSVGEIREDLTAGDVASSVLGVFTPISWYWPTRTDGEHAIARGGFASPVKVSNLRHFLEEPTAVLDSATDGDSCVVADFFAAPQFGEQPERVTFAAVLPLAVYQALDVRPWDRQPDADAVAGRGTAGANAHA